MRCLSCKYDLSNLTPTEGVHRCPECGRGFDPSDRSTFETPITISQRNDRRLVIAILVSLIIALLSCLTSLIFDPISNYL